MFALLALLAAAYLALPASGQRQVTDGFATILQGIGSFGLNPALAVGVVACVIVSLALILVPSYRRHSYLATVPSIIPPVSVYLDAENQLPAASIPPFTEFLIKHLDGRRADLLYFLDAAQTANGDKYKTLYRFGFRPVDVPHDPTGQGAVKEAVDRELAMHAYERAVLGPPEQEFIIVTGDADFVPLIYRLVALGHSVQIWASPVREAYRVVETYLGVNVIDLGEVIAELATAPAQNEPAPPANRNKRHQRRRQSTSKSRLAATASSARPAVPASLAYPGEEKLYYAILETLAAHTRSLNHSRADHERTKLFHSILGGEAGPRLSGVGYGIGNRIEYWIDHLLALDVLEPVHRHSFPARGITMEDDAARHMYAMARLAAQAAVEAAATHEDGSVTMNDIAAALDAMNTDADETVAPLLRLVAPDNRKRATHVRYFVRSAGALGLLVFDNVPNQPDVIRHPRLPDPIPVPETDTSREQEIPTDSAVITNADTAGADAHSDTSDAAFVVLDVATPVIAEGREADTMGGAAGESL